jgi:CBS domain-containing protein
MDGTKVKDVMTRDVISVTPATPVHKAAWLMVEHGVSGLPVVDHEGRLAGIVSEGDLILRQKPRMRPPWWRLFFSNGEHLAVEYRKAVGTTVGEVMTGAVLSVSPEMPLASATLIMDREHVRRLPVVADGQPVGIVSRGDLIKALAEAPAAGLPLSAAELVAEMKARVAAEPWAPGHALVVQARDGVLLLWGLVDNEAQKTALETMARSIPGARGLESQVMVRTEIQYNYAA